MGWFSDMWFGKDKTEKETAKSELVDHSHRVRKFRTNAEIIEAGSKDSAGLSSRFYQIFKDGEGQLYGVINMTPRTWFMGEEPVKQFRIVKDPFGSCKDVEVDLNVIGFHPLLTKEGVAEMTNFFKENSKVFLEHRFSISPVTMDNFRFVFDEGVFHIRPMRGYKDFAFTDWLQGKLKASTPELEIKWFVQSKKWEKFQAVINEATRIKLEGDLVVLTKGGNRSILLKEYFDHKWIDLGLKGTLFVQDIDSKDATSWSDVNVDRVTLSSMVKDIQSILDEAVGCERPEEVKNVVHYLNKAREIIKGEDK